MIVILSVFLFDFVGVRIEEEYLDFVIDFVLNG